MAARSSSLVAFLRRYFFFSFFREKRKARKKRNFRNKNLLLFFSLWKAYRSRITLYGILIILIIVTRRTSIYVYTYIDIYIYICIHIYLWNYSALLLTHLSFYYLSQPSRARGSTFLRVITVSNWRIVLCPRHYSSIPPLNASVHTAVRSPNLSPVL